MLDDLAVAVKKRAPAGVISTISPSLDELHAARLAEERGDRRGEEDLALADADDERRLAARADEQLRVVVVDRDEREVALELLVGGADGARRGRPRSGARSGATTTSASVSEEKVWPSATSDSLSSR